MEEVRWRVPVRVPVAKTIVTAVLGYLALAVADEAWVAVVTLAAAVGVALWAVRDLAVPVRVAADATGVAVVSGIRRRVLLPWSQVQRIRVDTRRRSRLLEIDTGDRLLVLSRHEVDADLAEVADRLTAMQRASG